jgi:hypothetical protein
VKRVHEELREVLEEERGFGHRAHVHLAWRYLRKGDLAFATSQMRSAIRWIAAEHGDAAKCHETLTMAWCQLVAAHVRVSDEPDFESFISHNPGLLDRSVLARHYSAAVLGSESARNSFAAPDLLPLP